MIDQNAGELFTEQQAAKILHMSQRRLYSLRKQGKIAYAGASFAGWF